MAPDDIDGRSPAVVAWHDGEMFFLIASDQMSTAELIAVACSLDERTRSPAAKASPMPELRTRVAAWNDISLECCGRPAMLDQ